MCTVCVKVDEALIRKVLPELDSTAAIRLWAQMLIDEHLKSLSEENDTMDVEDLREMLHETVRKEYALP